MTFQVQHQSFQFRVDFLRVDWFDLLAVQGILKSLLQNHSSKVSILLCPAFFIAQISHSYMTTGKKRVLIIQTFVSKVMSLLSNMNQTDINEKVRQSVQFSHSVVSDSLDMTV